MACGGSGGDSKSAPTVPPSKGTVLSTECDGYTLIVSVADGVGGTTEQVSEESPECGWNPPPAGEISSKYCEEYELVILYHDGKYSTTEERFPNSEECGYIAPSLEVSIENTYGDRFKPVVVTVDFKVQGEPSGDWGFDAEAGRAERVDDNTVHIWSQGEVGTFDFNVYDTNELLPRMLPWKYEIREEPRCEIVSFESEFSRVGLDCTNSRMYSSRRSTEFIYYGEDDDQIVQVELAITWYKVSAETPREIVDVDKLQQTQEFVDMYNEQFVKDGIYIEFILVGAYWSDEIELRQGELFIRSLPTDIGLGKGTSYPDTCGVAYPNFSFNYAGYGFSNCGLVTDLHELGHVVGLAHGPNNSQYAQEGYIFPDFGHGDYGQCGSRTDDIMSYGTNDHFFNSTQNCGERFPNYKWSGPAGDRTRADTAYAWNRIRYDLSLIHDEHSVLELDTQERVSPEDEERPLIID